MIRKRNILVLSAAFMLALAGWFLWGMRSQAYVPKSQAELDRNRNSRFHFEFQANRIPEDVRLNDAYWRERFAQLDVANECGKSLRDGIAIQITRSFTTNTTVTIVGDQLNRVDFPYMMPSAYRSATNGSKGIVFNPLADKVQLKRSISGLSFRQKVRLWFLLRDEDLFRFPEVQPDLWTMLDGDSGWIVVCRHGLRYAFSRNLNGDLVEPELRKLLEFAY